MSHTAREQDWAVTQLGIGDLPRNTRVTLAREQAWAETRDTRDTRDTRYTLRTLGKTLGT